MKHEWSLMSWLEVRDAAKEKPVVLAPLGCVETQGPYTPTGMEYIMASRLAFDVAERTGALALPALPFGNSDSFRDLPGTVYIRSEVLTELYYDILASVIRAGFDHVLCIAYHIPNEPPLERAARKLRDETGITIAWVNPGALAAIYLKDLFDDPVAARGHGAEPGISLMRYLVETEVPEGAKAGEQRHTLGGFDVRGAGLAFGGFPVGMPLSWSEFYPETGGFGNPTVGSVEIGKIMYDRIVDHLCGVVEVFSGTDVRNPAGNASSAD